MAYKDVIRSLKPSHVILFLPWSPYISLFFLFSPTSPTHTSIFSPPHYQKRLLYLLPPLLTSLADTPISPLSQLTFPLTFSTSLLIIFSHFSKFSSNYFPSLSPPPSSHFYFPSSYLLSVHTFFSLIYPCSLYFPSLNYAYFFIYCTSPTFALLTSLISSTSPTYAPIISSHLPYLSTSHFSLLPLLPHPSIPITLLHLFPLS